MNQESVLSGQVEVLLPGALDHGFDYLVPEDMRLAPGDLVIVPFGRGESLGVVWGAGRAKLERGKMKSILRRLDFNPLSAGMRRFIDWAAWYNCAPRGGMLKMTLPVSEPEKKGRLPSVQHAPAELHLARLSDSQHKAAASVEGRIGEGFSVTLLDGVTGSGKTEVYFDAIAQALYQDTNNQVLVLLPEIALSVQWLERFRQRFGFDPVIWHSEVTPARKRAGWQAIIGGEAKVVVGARSALFLPYRKLALLVVDEEHDSSYKQEEGVLYHARDMAVARGRFEALPVVLVSATPSLESYYNARQGKYHEVSLPARHGGAGMPDIHLIDMRSQHLERDTFVCPDLRAQLAQAVADGQQALLFLNRRGYAPLMLCRACGHRFQCPHCSAWLVLHKKSANAYLNCHHCDYRIPLPHTCPECNAEDSLHPCGPGVERLREEVASFLPQARLSIMASDSLSGPRELEAVVQDMEQRRTDILIGTQMVAKGYHFPHLSVVGVVDADLGLGGGDLRASERTYQLLHQLSGRAGREKAAGRVYLQSFLPGHPVMQALAGGSRDVFLKTELAARQEAGMPPFTRLAAIIVDGPEETQVAALARQIGKAAPRLADFQVWGPAPAPLSLLRGRFRYRLLVCAGRGLSLPDIMRTWAGSVSHASSLRIRIDIDPQSFF